MEDHGGRFGAGEFAHWLERHYESHIETDPGPPDELFDLARQCKAVVSSACMCAKESARMIFPGKSILVEAALNDFILPRMNIPFVSMSPRAWTVLGRTLWFMGYCGGVESLMAARARASNGADLLTRIAAYNKAVAFVGHGTIITFIARELRSRGWAGPVVPGRQCWDFTEYRCNLRPIKDSGELCSGPEAA